MEPESYKKETPFQLLAKASHQAKSERNSAFSLRKRLGSLELCNKVNIRRIKYLPEGSTVQAKLRTPNKCSSSLRLQHFRVAHCRNSWQSRVSLSSGNRASMRTESSSMPRNTKDVAGPAILSAANGTPRD